MAMMNICFMQWLPKNISKPKLILFVLQTERKRVNDFLSEKFIGNKNIFICRLDVLLQSAGSFKASERISLEEYRRNIGQFFEGLGLFDSALEMVFPSAVLEGNLRPSNSPVGQILLVSTEKVAANLKNSKSLRDKPSIVVCWTLFQLSPLLRAWCHLLMAVSVHPSNS
jgi:hypothetical protein